MLLLLLLLLLLYMSNDKEEKFYVYIHTHTYNKGRCCCILRHIKRYNKPKRDAYSNDDDVIFVARRRLCSEEDYQKRLLQ